MFNGERKVYNSKFKKLKTSLDDIGFFIWFFFFFLVFLGGGGEKKEGKNCKKQV